MIYVSQSTYNNACQQACIAMLTEQSLPEVIRILGENRLDEKSKVDYLAERHIHLGPALMTHGLGNNSIGYLSKTYNTLWCSLSDWKDVQYGHAILIHNRTVYDPDKGINPDWPSAKYISRIQPVFMPEY